MQFLSFSFSSLYIIVLFYKKIGQPNKWEGREGEITGNSQKRKGGPLFELLCASCYNEKKAEWQEQQDEMAAAAEWIHLTLGHAGRHFRHCSTSLSERAFFGHLGALCSLKEKTKNKYCRSVCVYLLWWIRETFEERTTEWNEVSKWKEKEREPISVVANLPSVEITATTASTTSLSFSFFFQRVNCHRVCLICVPNLTFLLSECENVCTGSTALIWQNMWVCVSLPH